MARGSFLVGANDAQGGSGRTNGAKDWYQVGSEEQKAIWTALDERNEHMIVNALAGVGKTFVMVEWAKRCGGSQGRVGLVAFNKHIATELTQRLGAAGSSVEAMTYHSLGFRLIREAQRRCRVDQYKVDGILDELDFGPDDWKAKQAKFKVKRLVSLAKQYGVSKRDELMGIVDLHDLDLNGQEELILSWTPKVMGMCKADLSVVDFDDMIWLPKELGLRGAGYDVLMVDEAQDTGLSQQWLGVNSTKRLIVVGDRNQAIYMFRGADSNSIGRMKKELGGSALGVVELPLTVTRRCPQSHVRLAQRLVPGLRALEGAAEGVVEERSRERAVESMSAGDLVVCRVNAELVGVAYGLLRRGVKAVVRGRDIGDGLTKLLDKAQKKAGTDKLSEVLLWASELTRLDIAKYMSVPHNRGASRAANAQDRLDCLMELCDGVGSTAELRAVIAKLFADFDESGKPNSAVVLGTVHRTKGLESERVWVLRPDLLPHPMAKGAEEVQQERNLLYVACTRSKRELYWVGRTPELLRD